MFFTICSIVGIIAIVVVVFFSMMKNAKVRALPFFLILALLFITMGATWNSGKYYGAGRPRSPVPGSIYEIWEDPQRFAWSAFLVEFYVKTRYHESLDATTVEATTRPAQQEVLVLQQTGWPIFLFEVNGALPSSRFIIFDGKGKASPYSPENSRVVVEGENPGSATRPHP